MTERRWRQVYINGQPNFSSDGERVLTWDAPNGIRFGMWRSGCGWTLLDHPGMRTMPAFWMKLPDPPELTAGKASS